MAKFQCTVSDDLDEVIGKVEIKTNSRERALEYLIYLARLMPSFKKKKYDGNGNNNCTLPMSDEIYGRDFAEYREHHIKKLRKKKHFFPDALARGASIYEVGYRLSSAMNPRDSTLQPDSVWRARAEQVASIIEFSSHPLGNYEDMKHLRREHERLLTAALYLLEKFPNHHVDDVSRGNIVFMNDNIVSFERESEVRRRAEFAREFIAVHTSRGIDLVGFDNWDAMQTKDYGRYPS